MECRDHDRAERVLRTLEGRFLDLDEETLCRWGRLFKEYGDAFLRLPWSQPDGPREPAFDLAEGFYRKSREKYEQAYRIRSGHYPGINLATILLILGSRRPTAPGVAPRPELPASEELARKLLATRPDWPREQDDDLTVWHPATAGEAYLILREWGQAANQYREALRSRLLTHHARDSMRRQVERILICFQNLGVAIPPPLDDPGAFFASGSTPSIGGASSDANSESSPPGPDPQP
jgi:hypothetical protein